MKGLSWFFAIMMLISGQLAQAEAIFVDTSTSMGYGLKGSSTMHRPLRRIDDAGKFLAYAFSNWEFKRPPTVLTWSIQATAVPGEPEVLAAYFDHFVYEPEGSTHLGAVMNDEYEWASCEPLLVVTDKAPSDDEKFEVILQRYLERTSVTIVIIETSDAARAQEYFSGLSALPHYLVQVVGEDSEEDVLLDLIAQQREQGPVERSNCSNLNA